MPCRCYKQSYDREKTMSKKSAADKAADIFGALCALTILVGIIIAIGLWIWSADTQTWSRMDNDAECWLLDEKRDHVMPWPPSTERNRGVYCRDESR